MSPRRSFLTAEPVLGESLQKPTGRSDPAGRDEQYEQLYVALMDANPFTPTMRFFLAGQPEAEVSVSGALDTLVAAVAERNPDFYECVNGKTQSVS